MAGTAAAVSAQPLKRGPSGPFPHGVPVLDLRGLAGRGARAGQVSPGIRNPGHGQRGQRRAQFLPAPPVRAPAGPAPGDADTTALVAEGIGLAGFQFRDPVQAL